MYMYNVQGDSRRKQNTPENARTGNFDQLYKFFVTNIESTYSK